MTARAAATLCALLALAACGSVELPPTTYYRLAPSPMSGGALLQGGTLGIGQVRLAAELASDRLVVREGPVRMSAYRFHQWAGPLDQLVADALETGLARAGCFGDVGASLVAPDYVLDARVLAFDLSVEVDGWRGLVAIEFRLTSASGDLLLRRELRASELAEERTPEAVVVALSRALDGVLTQLMGSCAELGLFERDPDAAPGR